MEYSTRIQPQLFPKLRTEIGENLRGQDFTDVTTLRQAVSEKLRIVPPTYNLTLNLK